MNLNKPTAKLFYRRAGSPVRLFLLVDGAIERDQRAEAHHATFADRTTRPRPALVPWVPRWRREWEE